MSFNFQKLRSDKPELAKAWTHLEQWFKENHRKGFVEPTILNQRMEVGLQPLVLSKALAHMLDAGVLKAAYRVKHNGALLEGQWDSAEDVPEKLWDRFCEYRVDVAEQGEIVFGYAWGG